MTTPEKRTFFPVTFEQGEKQKPIWWLASYPKSGNTWLRMFMTAYSSHGRVDINTAGVTTSDTLAPFLQMACAVPHSALTNCDIVHLRPAMLVNMLSLYPRRPLYVKTHTVNATIDGIPLVSPAYTMGATYLIRDPRDICVSYADHLGKTFDAAIDVMANPTAGIGDAHCIRTVVSRWDMHVNSWAASPMKIGVLKYEDLLENPYKHFTGMIHHMSIHFDKSHVYYGVGASTFKSLRGQEDESGFREKTVHQEKFFRRGTAGGWKDVLSKKQSGRIEKEFGSTMERFGYL